MKNDTLEIARRRHVARIGALRCALDCYRHDVDARKIADVELLFNLLVELRGR